MSPTQLPGSTTTPETAGPVKIVLERLPQRGADERLRTWIERLVTQASLAPGHEGGSVLSARAEGPHLILLRFASSAALKAWQGSTSYESLMRDADAFSTAGAVSQVQSGLETWFTLPDMPAPPKPPPKWKMAIVTWLALLPMVTTLSLGLAPLPLPFLLEVTLSTALTVVMLTWIVMPRITRALYHWLYPD